ncbi:MAG: hypothetical protein Ta2G_01630 [Termitinemataceae bacterium]|nr:MAG: hypothetical protein Ta2G_01630 [Termitinemataceae bacterium]
MKEIFRVKEIFKVLLLCSLFFVHTNVYSQNADKKTERNGYIVGTFSTGFGINPGFGVSMKGNFGTCVEWIKGGTVDWAVGVKEPEDTTTSWPLEFDLKIISKFGFGLCFGDLLTISMNYRYYDNNHLYFGLSYVYPIYKFDIGASLIVFPVYILGDELIAGKIDVSYWFNNTIGISLSTVFGGTTDLVYWNNVQAFLFSAVLGVSVKGTFKN